MKTTMKLLGWPLLAVVALAAAAALHAAEPAGQAGLGTAALESWLKSYGEAWGSRSADKAVALFSADATYQDDPYQAPYTGHDGIHKYWSGVTENQRNVKFNYKVLGVAGATGFAQWTAEFDVEPSQAHLMLNGVFVLEFGADGKCRSLREWWHLKSAEQAPASK